MTNISQQHDQPKLRSMSSPLEFWDTVRKECDRADRYDMRLAMVVYEIGIKNEKNLLVRTLVRKLSQRVRNMDFIGWFDPGNIGILMPHTPNDGVMKLAHDIFDLLSPLSSPPPFTIYTYPSNRWPVKKGILLRLLKIVNNIKMMINYQGISRADELQAQLELELERANRYGHTFSLLVFHRQEIMSHGVNLGKLVKTLNTRLRETDTFGWYGSGDIAIILPYSTLAYATQIGQTICEITGIPGQGTFTAYSYPHQWLSSGIAQLPEAPQPEEVSADLSDNDAPIPSSSPSFLDAASIKCSLDKEVMCSLLNGHDVSLLLFQNKNLLAHEVSVSTLAHTLTRRLRTTDHFGRHDKDTIAVILPCTGYEEAHKLAQAICESNHIPAQEIVAVYTYPGHWLPDGDAPTMPEHHHGTDRASECNCIRGNVPSPPPSKIDELIAQPIPLWKRMLDIVGSLVGIILFSPLLFLVAIGIRISSPGPIFFQQKRIGYKRKPFTLLKFRSMHAHADSEKHRKFMKEIFATGADRPNTKIENDDRIFPFGHFLRKTSIDELPQLFNVLKGEMSLVGPRPCLEYEAEEYLQWHTRRFHVLPGITGLWQVSGKNLLSFKQMIRLDIQYSKKISFWKDVSILLRTFPALVSIFFEKYK